MSNRFAGLDWASRTHAACVIDERGCVHLQLEVDHDAAGLAELCRRLRGAGVTAVAIERPSGLIVDALLEAGFSVVPIHPNVVKATRPRYRSHGGKSDASDAYLLADLLRTDGHRFKPLLPQSDDIRALRALAFVLRYPTPESADRLGLKRMAAFCAQHAYSGRRSAQELLDRLHQAPAVAVGELEMEAKGELALSLARNLDRLVDQIRLLTSRIEHHVGAIDDGRILMSFPRAGRICAAQILAELGSVRERFDSDDHLAAEAGVAPVTYASGKSKAVTFRWACNHRLRAALTCMADNSRHANAWAASVYAKARGRGCDHPHAIRILSRAWLRVIWRAWTDRKPYDPALHRGAQLILNASGG